MDLSYDGNGMLVGYTQNDTYSDWAGAQFTNVYSREMTRDGDRILSEKVTSIDGSLLTNDVKTVNYAYDERGASGMRVNGKNYYFVRNLFGDVTAIYDTSGVKKAEYSYDAWGTCYTTLDTDGLGSLNPFRYRGYYYISRIGLYYLTTRFYDYTTGRFLNADVPSIGIEYGFNVPEGCNLYTYCLNNPISYVDPTGHFVFSTAILVSMFIGAAVGGIVSAGSSIISQWISKGWDNINWGQVGFNGLIGLITGGVMASPLGALATGIAVGGLSFTQSVGNDLFNNSGDWSQVNWGKAAVVGVVSGVIAGGSKYLTNNTSLMNKFVNKTSSVKTTGETSLKFGLDGRGSYIDYWMNVMVMQTVYRSGISAIMNALRSGSKALIEWLW